MSSPPSSIKDFTLIKKVKTFFEDGMTLEDWVGAAREGLNRPDIEPSDLANIYENMSIQKEIASGAAKENEEASPDNFLNEDPNRHSIEWMLSKPSPNREFLVQDIIPKVKVGVISADGGTGKSFLMLHLAVSLASGQPFMGYEIPLESIGSTVIFNAEDDLDENHRRIEAIKTHSNQKIDKGILSKIIIPPLENAQDFVLYSAVDKAKSKTEQIITYLKKIPNLKLVVLDPANMIFEGDSNSQTDVSQLYSELYKISNEVGCMILIIAHNNKSSSQTRTSSQHDTMGSAAWINRARMGMNLKYLANSGGLIEATLTKCNYLSRADRVFKMMFVKDGKGVLERFKQVPATELEQEETYKNNYKAVFDFLEEHMDYEVDYLNKIRLEYNKRPGTDKVRPGDLELVLRQIEDGVYRDWKISMSKDGIRHLENIVP